MSDLWGQYQTISKQLFVVAWFQDDPSKEKGWSKQGKNFWYYITRDSCEMIVNASPNDPKHHGFVPTQTRIEFQRGVQRLFSDQGSWTPNFGFFSPLWTHPKPHSCYGNERLMRKVCFFWNCTEWYGNQMGLSDLHKRPINVKHFDIWPETGRMDARK